MSRREVCEQRSLGRAWLEWVVASALVGVAAAGCSSTMAAAGASTGDGPSSSASIEPFDSNPPAEDPDFAQAKKLIEAQKYADAVPLLEKVVAKDAKNAEAQYTLGLAYDSTNQAPKAEKAYRAALDLNPKLVEALMNLGALYLNSDPPRPNDAVPLLHSAHELDPGDVKVLENLALGYSLLKDYGKAQKAYEAAVKVDDTVQTHFAFAAMLLEAGKIPEGTEELKRAAAKTDDVEILSDIARVFGKVKAFDQCVSTFDTVLSKKPTSKAFMARGECKHAKKDESGATADFRQAVALEPKSPAAHFYLGMSLIEEKKDAEAKKELTLVCTLGESDACKNAKIVLKKHGW